MLSETFVALLQPLHPFETIEFLVLVFRHEGRNDKKNLKFLKNIFRIFRGRKILEWDKILFFLCD